MIIIKEKINLLFSKQVNIKKKMKKNKKMYFILKILKWPNLKIVLKIKIKPHLKN